VEASNHFKALAAGVDVVEDAAGVQGAVVREQLEVLETLFSLENPLAWERKIALWVRGG